MNAIIKKFESDFETYNGLVRIFKNNPKLESIKIIGEIDTFDSEGDTNIDIYNVVINNIIYYNIDLLDDDEDIPENGNTFECDISEIDSDVLNTEELNIIYSVLMLYCAGEGLIDIELEFNRDNVKDIISILYI